ncbi:MAG: NAD(P)H-dependent glycerol-3-phosphate dehydrogenase, partial [Verrucomicrobiae bacterium]|nr:NAD(P)H-dependent glycerol-3-phosphate dehydrogenase [Verrucomicrobiae bacterium]
MNVTVIGTGGWGTALAVLLHRNGHRVTLWGRSADEVEPIVRDRENKRFLPGVPVPLEVRIVLDMATAAAGADAIVLAVPSHGMRNIARQLSPLLRPKCHLVHVAKGIEVETTARMTQVIAEETGRHDCMVLSGPSHAEEVGRGIPTAVVLAGRDATQCERARPLFMNDRFRVYTHDDVTGVELGGAIKNVLAIAAGVCDGLGFGDNTKAALCTRGLAEMARLGVALGARRETFFGLSGLGDLVVTAFSRHSRNRAFGERLGRGETAEQILASTVTVAEGVKTARSVMALAKTH